MGFYLDSHLLKYQLMVWLLYVRKIELTPFFVTYFLRARAIFVGKDAE